MTSFTRIALRHRRLVVFAWILLAGAGVLTLSSTTSKFTHSFATGTPGYSTNHAIERRFGIDGNEQPTVAVLYLPAGETMHTAAGRATAARTFGAAPRAGHLAVADYANTGNPKLVSPDGRTTRALIDMPNPDIGIGQVPQASIGGPARCPRPFPLGQSSVSGDAVPNGMWSAPGRTPGPGSGVRRSRDRPFSRTYRCGAKP